MLNSPLRIGVLGAARITPMALLKPARLVPEASVTAVAARDRSRAQAFANKHGIATVHADYASLIDDPTLDAIYNPLPNSHHAEWSIRALEAGKHVLCEKPLASNARECVQMAEAAKKSGKVLMEAFHYRFHPLMTRVLEIVSSGELGAVKRIETAMCIPLPLPGDIRYRADLAGGAMMDVGCYALHMLRTVAGAEPQVVSARPKLSSEGVDRAMDAEFSFADGRSGAIECSLFSSKLLKLGIVVIGSQGELRVLNATVPQIYHHLTVRTAQGKRRERVQGDATYTYQLRGFVAAVRGQGAPLISLDDSIANMRAIDAAYEAAGMHPRGT